MTQRVHFNQSELFDIFNARIQGEFKYYLIAGLLRSITELSAMNWTYENDSAYPEQLHVFLKSITESVNNGLFDNISKHDDDYIIDMTEDTVRRRIIAHGLHH